MATRRQRLARARIGLGDQWTDQINAASAPQNPGALVNLLTGGQGIPANTFDTPPKTVTLRLADGSPAAAPAASTGMSTTTKVVLVVGGAAAVGGIAWLLLK